MGTIFDFSFQDGHNLSAYKLSLSGQTPSEAVISNNMLNVIAGEVLFHTGLKSGAAVQLTLKNASGDAVINDQRITPSTKDVALDLNVKQNGIIYLNVPGNVDSGTVQLKFSGYTLTNG